ncbi:Uncharacterised protein [Legionella pneumophila subsp. pascullei]|uniref:Uncharacterized protein n=1 Tax=Legionella pneumophila subsp. pascullei TaxID=91890 RepID=A0AAX2IZI0_LEGPN|nr:Uncharacterised protein [Legionella pneumophila subsp. pascullei]VEH07559.1 Uncharacterised protein [Legionella pneumophila subsp. pascullei]
MTLQKCFSRPLQMQIQEIAKIYPDGYSPYQNPLLVIEISYGMYCKELFSN